LFRAALIRCVADAVFRKKGGVRCLPGARPAMADFISHAVCLISLGLIAAVRMPGVAVTYSVREHDHRGAARKVPLAPPPGAVGG
jgi:hypothetical protein